MRFKPKKHKSNEHSNRNRNILWALFITFLFVGSYFGYTLFSNPEDTLTYKGVRFTATTSGYVTQVNGKQVQFSYHPSQLEGINLSSAVTERIKASKMMYLTADPYVNSSEKIALAKFELSAILSDLFSIYTVNSFTENSTYGLPIATCQNATASAPVLYFKESNETAIMMRDDCIYIEARSPNDFIAEKDRLVYGLLGVMK